MYEIKSKDNRRVKRAKKISSGKTDDLVFVEGARIVQEALKSGVNVAEAFVSNEFIKTRRRLVDEILEKEIRLFSLPDQVFAQIAATKSSQGIALICEKPPAGRSLIEARTGDHNVIPVIVLLHRINNPSNLGAILRTVEAADAIGVITTTQSARPFSPKSTRASMGSNLRLPMWEKAEFEDAIEWSKGKGFSPVLADADGKTSHTGMDWSKPRLLVLGSEAHGLREEEKSLVKDSVFVPMKKGVESLNIAVSCGIVLYEAVRQNSR